MSEYREEVRTVRVNFRCNSCKKGNIEFTGSVKMLSKPLYQHRCNYCGALSLHNIRYPDIRYDTVREHEQA